MYILECLIIQNYLFIFFYSDIYFKILSSRVSSESKTAICVKKIGRNSRNRKMSAYEALSLTFVFASRGLVDGGGRRRSEEGRGEVNAVETWYSRSREWESVGEIMTESVAQTRREENSKIFLRVISLLNICDYL